MKQKQIVGAEHMSAFELAIREDERRAMRNAIMDAHTALLKISQSLTATFKLATPTVEPSKPPPRKLKADEAVEMAVEQIFRIYPYGTILSPVKVNEKLQISPRIVFAACRQLKDDGIFEEVSKNHYRLAQGNHAERAEKA